MSPCRSLGKHLDWNLLKVFLEISRCQGVTRAASVMARQQPAVSGSLKRLEEAIGVKLCRRGPSGFELTAEGEMVAAIASRMAGSVVEMQQALARVDREPSGQLHIVMVQNLVCESLDATIAAFNRRYANVELVIRNVLLPDVEQLVVSGEAEIGIGPVVPDHAALAYTFLYREQHRPFCGRDHELFGRTYADCADLADEVFVLPDVEEAEVIRRYRHRHGWGRRHVGRSPYLGEVRRMVAAGLGIGFLPEEMLQADIAMGSLWPLMAPHAEAQADVLVLTNPADTRSAETNCFLNVLAATLDRRQAMPLDAPSLKVTAFASPMRLGAEFEAVR